MRFTKVQGLGNDFLIVDGLREQLDLTQIEQATPQICDRHFGVGGDGVLLLLPSTKANYLMRLINSDGSEAEMCGNGIRCFGKYIYDTGLHPSEELAIETLAGIQYLQLNATNGKVESVRVDMGEPRLQPEEIPTTLAGNCELQIANCKLRMVRAAPLEVDGRSFAVTCVSTGNPHCVIFLDDVSEFPFKEMGPKIEHHPAFPKRTNVHFVQVMSRTEVNVKVWERGAGATLACGTGACAVLVAGVLNERTERKATVYLPGGPLEIEWTDNNHVFMTGPATIVYEGEIDI